MSFGGGGKSSVEYTQSPEQREVFKLLIPFLKGMYGQGTTTTTTTRGPSYTPGGTNQTGPPSMYDPEGRVNPAIRDIVGKMPSLPAPGGSGGTTTTTTFNPDVGPAWAIPAPPSAPELQFLPEMNLSPTKGWYNNLDGGIKRGLWEPYQAGADQILERFGGTASAGFSPATGAALGEYYADVSPTVGLQAWNMLAPQRQYDVMRGGNMTDAYNQRAMADYNAAMNAWGQDIQARSFPITAIPGLLGGTYSNPVVNQGGGLSIGGAMGGGLTGALGASMMGWNPLIGGLLGAGAGLFGG